MKNIALTATAHAILPTVLLTAHFTPSTAHPLPPCRFTVLERSNPEVAERLHHELDEHIHLRQERMVNMSKARNPPPPAPEGEQK